MPVIRDPTKLDGRRGTIYPAEFAAGFGGRIKRALGDAPGAISALRHWHSSEDEFVFVLAGELTLITDGGEDAMTAGMAATFPAGEANAHQLANRGSGPATYLEIGTRARDDDIAYPDVDLRLVKRDGRRTFVRKSGEPYE